MKRLFIAAAFLFAPCLLSAAEAANPACGDTLTTDTTLTGDMACAGTALRIGADGITVDLNGFTLTGDGVTFGAAGVRNAGFNNVTIENGTITNFFFGVYLNGASANTIRAITADANVSSGIFVENGSNHNTIVASAVVNNGTPAHRGNGITMNGSAGNLVTWTLAENNYTQGIFVGGGGIPAAPASSNTRILNNTSRNNVSNGIGIIGGSGHSVAGNISADNGGHGVSFSSAIGPGSVTDSWIFGNSLSGNALNGIGMNNSHGNRIVANRVTGNVLTGILLTDAGNNTIGGNRVNANGVHGLLLRSASDNNLILGNAFDSNTLRGILVSVGGESAAPADNRFLWNHAKGNTLFDVQDETIGDGTLGTDSTWRGTRCNTSSPNGLCMP